MQPLIRLFFCILHSGLGPLYLLIEVRSRQMPEQCWPAPKAQLKQDCRDQVPCLRFIETPGAIITYLNQRFGALA